MNNFKGTTVLYFAIVGYLLNVLVPILGTLAVAYSGVGLLKGMLISDAIIIVSVIASYLSFIWYKEESFTSAVNYFTGERTREERVNIFISCSNNLKENMNLNRIFTQDIHSIHEKFFLITAIVAFMQLNYIIPAVTLLMVLFGMLPLVFIILAPAALICGYTLKAYFVISYSLGSMNK